MIDKIRILEIKNYAFELGNFKASNFLICSGMDLENFIDEYLNKTTKIRITLYPILQAILSLSKLTNEIASETKTRPSEIFMMFLCFA